ncbi:MAG: type II toxin-antitoxin system RelB/DinJ family antitoxin [Chloroflexota bacterium]
MANTTSISAQIDPDLKERAEEILSELELTASQAIALFYKQIVFKRGIPFEIVVPHDENNINGHSANSLTNGPSGESKGVLVEPGPEAATALGPEHEAILKEREAYEVMHTELRELYPDQYVAVYQGEVVDHDSDKVALIIRRREKYPNKTVLITQVEESPERKTLNFRSPRFVR